MITLLDYEKHTRSLKTFGRLKLHVLDPLYWAIGKFGRYLEPDIRDLIRVCKRRKIGWKKMTHILGLALKGSPKSTHLFTFRKQVEHFLRTYGQEVWGGEFVPKTAIRSFHQYAGIR